MARKKATTTTDGKKGGLSAILLEMGKKYGTGNVKKLGDDPIDIKKFSTGVPSFDIALGGGIAEGRVVEMYGPESSGKTSLALSCVAEIQKLGHNAAFIDAEHAFSPEHAQSIGVDINNLILSQPDHGEQALQIAQDLAATGEVKIIVIDSVAALIPKAEVEGDMDDQQMGLQARIMAKGLRKLTGVISKTGTIIIFINQLRMKIGVMFGNPETTTGGNSLKFYATQRIDIRKKEVLKDENKEPMGHIMKGRIIKNKVGFPGKIAEATFYYDRGFDKNEGIVSVLLNLSLVKQSGAFFTLLGNINGEKDKKFQGRNKLIEYIKSNNLYNELKKLTDKTINDTKIKNKTENNKNNKNNKGDNIEDDILDD